MTDTKEALILLAAGRDRPGIVERLSGVVYAAGCNLEDSRMALLGGEFALIVLVTGGSGNLVRAREGLEALGREMELVLQIKRTARGDPQGGPQLGLSYQLRAVAMDHPGIVHKITRLLSSYGVNLARLDTRLSHAPVSGTPVFALELEAQIPSDVELARLRSGLDELASSENIDIDFRAVE